MSEASKPHRERSSSHEALQGAVLSDSPGSAPVPSPHIKRTPREIAETGAAWVTETELADLIEQLEAAQKERDEWAREFKRVQDIGLANSAETASLINSEMEEQLEAAQNALREIAENDLTAHQTRSGAHAYRQTREFARRALNPAKSLPASGHSLGMGRGTEMATVHPPADASNQESKP